MALKLVIVCIALCCLAQLATAAPRSVRETEPKKSDTSKEIDDALNVAKSSIDQLVKNIQDNDMLKDLSSMLQKFGDQVQDQSKQIVKKIQDSAATA